MSLGDVHYEVAGVGLELAYDSNKAFDALQRAKMEDAPQQAIDAHEFALNALFEATGRLIGPGSLGEAAFTRQFDSLYVNYLNDDSGNEIPVVFEEDFVRYDGEKDGGPSEQVTEPSRIFRALLQMGRAHDTVGPILIYDEASRRYGLRLEELLEVSEVFGRIPKNRPDRLPKGIGTKSVDYIHEFLAVIQTPSTETESAFVDRK